MVYRMAVQTNEDVAAKVRGVAAEKRVSRAAVGEVLNISEMGVSRRFNGKTPFSPSELIQLAALFNVPVSTFFGEQSKASA